MTLANGQEIQADLIVAADGVNSSTPRDLVGLLEKRREATDGEPSVFCFLTRPRTKSNSTVAPPSNTRSGSRRVLYTPCSSDTMVYVALTMLDEDEVVTCAPIRSEAWIGWFPHLSDLIPRIGTEGRYDRFEYIKLKRWSAGRVVVLGDAAHALPPNIGQGAGCAMMNALSLGVFLDRYDDILEALANWERQERSITDHTQRCFAVSRPADDVVTPSAAPASSFSLRAVPNG